MKLTIYEEPSVKGTKIVIRCPSLDNRLQRLVGQIRQYSHFLTGYQESRQYQLPLESIFYLESTDGTTFLYQEKEVYVCRESLAALEPQLARSGFVRIGKSCILNVAFLKYVEPVFNYRLKAILKNGKSLILLRTKFLPLFVQRR